PAHTPPIVAYLFALTSSATVPPMPPVSVAVAQLTSRENVGANLARCQALIADAAARGARLVALPENFAFLCVHGRDKFRVAEVLDEAQPGPILAALKESAARERVWVIGGGMPERATTDAPASPASSTSPPEPPKVHNTCVVIDDAGRLVATYRKIHLFDV